MGLLDFITRRKKTIDFSEVNVQVLTKLSDEMGDTLIKAGFGFWVDYLSQIRLAADKRNEEEFKKLIISNELFGGAGAIWEVWIEDRQLRAKFNKQFCDYIDLLKSMGIENGRVNQIRSSFDKY